MVSRMLPVYTLEANENFLTEEPAPWEAKEIHLYSVTVKEQEGLGLGYRTQPDMPPKVVVCPQMNVIKQQLRQRWGE